MSIVDPCKLLEQLVKLPNETEWVEFKENKFDPNDAAEYASALANAAMLADRDRAFLVFGVQDKTHAPVGTNVFLKKEKIGGENFENWINRVIEPRLMIEIIDFECDGKRFALLAIEPSYDRPVAFKKVAYIRIGENKKKLADHPEHERALWFATGRRKFEQAVAASNVTPTNVLDILDTKIYYKLTGDPLPPNDDEKLRKFESNGFIRSNLEGGYDITNMGAILFASDIKKFPSIATKSVRVIRYTGKDKSHSDKEQEGELGYAVGFRGLIRYIMENLPHAEEYQDGVRRRVPLVPEVAIRETVANALIHQDFTMSGAGPVIEIYSNRVEVSNPGNSLIVPDRMLDERRSRNENLAKAMRNLGLCEERGGGLDKLMLAIEKRTLPAPDLISSQDSMRVVLFGPRPFSQMSKAEKQRACFFHCVLCWIQGEPMGNASLRQRFSLSGDDYQAVSAVITEAVKAGRIAPAELNQGKRNAKYVPYWAA
jgi:predicted HTH transcriptional regulator